MGVTVDLEARRVLVTGASSGIGAAVSRSIIAAGGSVATLARRVERLDALCAELGERAHAVPGDVTDLEHLDAAVDDAAARTRRSRRRGRGRGQEHDRHDRNRDARALARIARSQPHRTARDRARRIDPLPARRSP